MMAQPIAQPVMQPQMIPQQPIMQPQMVQQPVMQPQMVQQPVMQPQMVQQPQMIPQQQFQQPMYEEVVIEEQVAEKSEMPSYIIMAIMLFGVYYLEHAQKCRSKAGGSLDYKSFMRNGFWTIGLPLFFTKILTNLGPYKAFKSMIGENIVTYFIDGFVLYFIYNLVRNWRNITDKNTCEMSEATKKARKEAAVEKLKKKMGVKESFDNISDKVDEINKLTNEIKMKLQNDELSSEEIQNYKQMLKDITPLQDKIIEQKQKVQDLTTLKKTDLDLLKKSNQMPIVQDDIHKAQKILNEVDIIVGRIDIFQAVDKLQREQREINLENLQKVLDTINPQRIKSQRELELEKTLPAERRLPSPIKIREMPKFVAPTQKTMQQRATERKPQIDDAAIRAPSGRLLGINLEKQIEAQNKLLLARR